MIDRNLDRAFIELNKRIKEKETRDLAGWFQKIARGVDLLAKGEWGLFLKKTRHCLFTSRSYTTKGNLDWEKSSPKMDVTGLKIAVYSCITANYDTILEPLYAEPGIDYILFTDMDVPEGSQWKKIDITGWQEYTELTPVQLNRKVKMLPFRYLPDYDYSIYVDGNMEIVAPVSPLIEEMGNHGLGVHYHRVRDCIYDEVGFIICLNKADSELSRRQLAAYEKEGFPCHYGLYENPVIIRKHGDKEVCRLMEAWWEEYLRYSTRDQFSLPYIIWKTGYDRSKIHIIEKDLNHNYRFNWVHPHNRNRVQQELNTK